MQIILLKNIKQKGNIVNKKAEKVPPVGQNLKQERIKHHLSLGELAAASGISKAMLSQIESGKVNPTLVTIWKIANALSVDIAVLIKGEEKADYFHRLSDEQQAEILSDDGKVLFKILTAPSMPEGLEMYHITVEPGAIHVSEPHSSGCKEFVFVFKGSVTVTNGEHRLVLNQGDFLAYDGGLPHSIENHTKKSAELHMTDFS